VDYADQAKIRCFGGRAALTAELTHTRKDQTPTVSLEVAPRLLEKVDWENKIVVQLSDSELPLACAVVLGYLPNVHFKRPGKGVEITRQPGKLFVRASSGTGKIYALPVPPGDTFRLSALFLGQLKRQAELSDGTLVLAALRGAASLYQDQEPG